MSTDQTYPGALPQGTPAAPTYATPGAPGVAAGAPYDPGHPVPPAPKKRSWFARHKITTAILALIAVVLFVNAVGGGEEPSTPAAETAGAASGAAAPAEQAPADAAATEAAPAEAPPAGAAPEAAPAAAGIGTPVRDGKFELTVTGIEAGVASVGNEFLNEQAQGQFVLVHVTVANIGDQAQAFFDSNQTLVDTLGREHSANTSAGIYMEGNDLFFTDINPGNAVSGAVVFDIPADAVPASIELHDSMFSGGVSVALAQ